MKGRQMIKTISPEMKSFMSDLWGAEGNFIDTPLGRGRIESVRTKAGLCSTELSWQQNTAFVHKEICYDC
jgi:hypothetical protein